MAARESSRGGTGGIGVRDEPTTGRMLTLAFGAIFTVVGIWGFVLTGVDTEWFDHDSDQRILGLFEVNGFHNLAHLLFGLLGIVAAARITWALAWNVFVAVAYAGLFVYGLFAVGETWNVLSINWGDNWLHLALAALGVVVALVLIKELRDIRDAAMIDLRERTTPTPGALDDSARASQSRTRQPGGQASRPPGR